MPEVNGFTSMVINLHNRCQTYKTLPFPGGLMDQPSWIMRLFDAIDGATVKWRRDKDDEARRKNTLAGLR